jgi:hypothetical protein
MSKRVELNALPLSYMGADQIDDYVEQFYDVHWNQNFGAFKSGETCSIVSVDYNEGRVSEYSEEGAVLRSQRWLAIPRG